ncbi:hypothetical protein MANES_10G008500v8 [Manihot esculenta]|nr:hypothetical protein MANES_10G008500v8 [Manihot esculenta]
MNIEVSLDAAQIPNLKEFVSHLTQIMHSSVPGSLVIWYDSVTITGELLYQNQLNEKNKPFFDICDGIFANYGWEEDYPKLSAAVAGDRKFDVYMGIDVFGRGTYGGGQWNTNTALDVCKKDDVSAVLFAPGWVYETKQPPDFQTAQNKWWSLVKKSWGVVKFYPNSLPFYSNFDQGRGYHISVEGVQVSNSPWNNISSQGFQPFLEYKDNPTPDSIQVLVDFKEESYSGGVNITFKGTLKDNNDFTARLFQGNLLLGELPLHLTYSVKSDVGSMLGLSLQFSSNLDERTLVLIAPWEANQLSNKFSKVIVPHMVNTQEMAPGWVIQESSIQMNGYTLTEIHAVCYRPKPEIRKLRLEHKSDESEVFYKSSIDLTTEEVINNKPPGVLLFCGSIPDDQTCGGSQHNINNDTSAQVSSEYFAVLGHITIKTSKENPVFPPSSSWLVEGQYIKLSSGSQGSKKLSVKITWKLKDGSKFQSSKYNIYVEKLAKTATGNSGGRVEDIQEYIGVAYVEAFYVYDLAIPSNITSLKFIVQVCGVDGACQKLDDSPYYQLDVEASHQVTIPICNYEEMASSRTGANPGRRLYINSKHYGTPRMWGDFMYDRPLRERTRYVIVDMLRRFGKIDAQIYTKERGLSWLLLMSLVVLGMILWVLNYSSVKM